MMHGQKNIRHQTPSCVCSYIGYTEYVDI